MKVFTILVGAYPATVIAPTLGVIASPGTVGECPTSVSVPTVGVTTLFNIKLGAMPVICKSKCNGVTVGLFPTEGAKVSISTNPTLGVIAIS